MSLFQRKIAVLMGGLALVIASCAPQKDYAPFFSEHSVRVSDRYSLRSVRSFEMYDAGMDEHSIAYVRLVSGDAFPMICFKTAEGSYPIPQSVFQEQGKQRWYIMCEPRTQKDGGTANVLMMCHFAMEDGKLVNEGRVLKPIRKSRLIERPSLP